MSRRTSEATKAIKEAWEKEYQLVLKGKGTRDWTVEQQISIMEKGRAYDADGRAMEGHHMKSAELFPYFQRNADNIQFLTRNEHWKAHGGNYRNPTNGYYDPDTGITQKFGTNELQPCEIKDLSYPVALQNKGGLSAKSNGYNQRRMNHMALELNAHTVEVLEQFGVNLQKNYNDFKSAGIVLVRSFGQLKDELMEPQVYELEEIISELYAIVEECESDHAKVLELVKRYTAAVQDAVNSRVR